MALLVEGECVWKADVQDSQSNLYLYTSKGKEIRLSSVQASIVAKLGEGKSLDNVLPHETDTEDAVDTDDGKVRSTCLSSHTCLEGQICRAEKSDIPIMLKY